MRYDPASEFLIAVDIGNSRMKLGRFPLRGVEPARPENVLEIDPGEPEFPSRVASWLATIPGQLSWSIASVNRPAGERLADWLAAERPRDFRRALGASDLPLAVRLPRPDRVGIDRLLAAVAVNQLRDPSRPAAIAQVGTAITVNLLSAGGEFLGGAILPGIRMAARALHEQTDLLPDIELLRLEDPPPPVGTSTPEAIHAGLFWGAVGAIRELVAKFALEVKVEPEVFLTGGAAPHVARLLADEARYDPHLVLAGIALATRSGHSP